MFNRSEHITYYKHCLQGLPGDYIELDTQRIVLLYFCVLGLDVLGGLSDLTHEEKNNIIGFVTNNKLKIEFNGVCTQGFVGSPFLGPVSSYVSTDGDYVNNNTAVYIHHHLAMTYSALGIMAALEHPVPQTMVDDIMRNIPLCQTEDGSFSISPNASECDMRFVYCACVITSMIKGGELGFEYNSVFNVEAMCSYIKKCVTYEGGFSLYPGGEAVGGATYCAVASLVLTDTLTSTLSPLEIQQLTHWLMHRQVGGYNGRTNKPPDSCYSFWIGASLALLGQFSLTDVESTRALLVNACQFEINLNLDPRALDQNAPAEVIKYCTRCGFCKVPQCPPDVLHTFYSIVWLSISASNSKSDPTGDKVDSVSVSRDTESEIQKLRSVNPANGLCLGKRLIVQD